MGPESVLNLAVFHHPMVVDFLRLVFPFLNFRLVYTELFPIVGQAVHHLTRAQVPTYVQGVDTGTF